MKNLAQENCIPCKSDIPPLNREEIDALLKDIPDWELVEIDGIYRLKRTFSFKNFAEALAFTNKIGALSEEQGHHPLIELTWGQVAVQWWTHKIKGLNKNDLIMALKTEEAYQ